MDEGSLYPALHRMEEAGWITAEWTITENKRRARIYRINRAGAKQLAAETENWRSFFSRRGPRAPPRVARREAPGGSRVVA